jgi:hypothetical protein
MIFIQVKHLIQLLQSYHWFKKSQQQTIVNHICLEKTLLGGKLTNKLSPIKLVLGNNRCMSNKKGSKSLFLMKELDHLLFYTPSDP